MEERRKGIRQLNNEDKQTEDISLRGKTARHLVKVANHMPVLGPMRLNGELQNLISEHEREFKYAASLKNTVINMDLYKMELLEKKDDATDKGMRYVILQLHGGGYYGKLHNAYRAVAAYYHEITGGFDVFDIFEKPLRLSPELLGSEACLFLKQAGEVLGVLEAEGVGYLADGVGGRSEAVTGLSDEVLLDELLRTVARLGFH